MRPLILLTLVLSACTTFHTRAYRVKGAPTDTAFIATVTSGQWGSDQSGLWYFEALEKPAPARRFSGWTVRRLKKGEDVVGTCAGFDRFGGCAYWRIERVSLARERARRK